MATPGQARAVRQEMADVLAHLLRVGDVIGVDLEEALVEKIERDRRVVVSVQVRRMVCPVLGCPRQRFREQVPELLERSHRTTRWAVQLGHVVEELAGRAGARLSRYAVVAISRSTALRMLMWLPLAPLRVPRVLSVDGFA
ncbi:hypothetical protein [Streptomyces sp. NPDC056938]|uniref:hypothetical protein n=1 Tax=unclassified Streptomyces TaxID=2593676 RepID=UPI003630305A